MNNYIIICETDMSTGGVKVLIAGTQYQLYSLYSLLIVGNGSTVLRSQSDHGPCRKLSKTYSHLQRSLFSWWVCFCCQYYWYRRM